MYILCINIVNLMNRAVLFSIFEYGTVSDPVRSNKLTLGPVFGINPRRKNRLGKRRGTRKEEGGCSEDGVGAERGGRGAEWNGERGKGKRKGRGARRKEMGEGASSGRMGEEATSEG